jgi:hypothetical protein
MKAITYINKCIKYLHLFHNHLVLDTALSDYRKTFVENALQCSPTSLVEPPRLNIPAIKNRTTLEKWIMDAKAGRKGFWKELRNEKAIIKKESRVQFTRMLQKEEYMCSQKYRNIVYGKGKNESAAITLLTDDGSLEFSADGIME